MFATNMIIPDTADYIELWLHPLQYYSYSRLPITMKRSELHAFHRPSTQYNSWRLMCLF